jgi:predicted RNA binding protein YcfA (HicA-like mRNA interferase family)
MDSRDVLAPLRADGWEHIAQKGSQLHLKHPVEAGRVTVPHPRRDLPIGTLKSIERQG